MRVHKALLLAAVLCAIAVAGGVAAVTHADTGAAGLQVEQRNVPPGMATAPAAISAANTGYGVCNTGPGVACAVDYIMSKGTATATAYALGGGLERSLRQTCDSATCGKGAIAIPTPNVTVNYWSVTGPNISVICAGPTWLC
jgi:hypothetical protein